MKLKLIILIFFTSANLIGQSKNIFKVQTEIKAIDEITKIGNEIDSASNSAPFFEDNNYIVTAECNGEWGGTITFKNKKTNDKFICGSTCPVTILKEKNKYIVTNTLNHLMATTEILEIENPENLKKIKAGPNKVNETLGRKGAKIILKEFEISTLFSYQYNGVIYYIVSSRKETFIAKIENGKFKKIQSLANTSFIALRTRISKTNDGSYLVFFSTYKNRGYLKIKGNSIKIFSHK